MRRIAALFAFASAMLAGSVAWAGAVFVSGHDSIWHANFGPNTSGAAHFAQTAIEFARDGNSAKFLFIESTTVAVPPGNAREAPFLTSALGYSASDFDVMNGAQLAALADFRATLGAYSAIVVASDHGGMLTAAELNFLNAHAADVLDYINDGGGVAAFAESNAQGLITGATPFGFIPFLVTSTALGEAESGNTVTAYGSSIGILPGDVNNNFSHNIFTATGGMNPVDLRNGDPDQILSLAFKGSFNEEGVTVPEPMSMVVLGAGLFAIGLLRRRRRA